MWFIVFIGSIEMNLMVMSLNSLLCVIIILLFFDILISLAYFVVITVLSLGGYCPVIYLVESEINF